MIKLNRNFTPILLNPSFVKAKIQEFKDTSKNVWNIDWLKESLLSLSNGKCAYCECDLKEESKYMEVEHFEDKDSFPNKVLEWDNLLPSCKRCNGSKSTHDVIFEPIINPFLDEPSTHLYFRLYRMKGKDAKGKQTIDVVDLNHYERAVQKRFEVGEALEKLIDTASDRLELYLENSIVQRQNKLKNIVEDILKECQPNSIYSSTCATVLHTNDTYLEIKKKLKELKLWNDYLEKLDNVSKNIILLK